MADLSLGNVFEISVTAPGAGVGEYNSSNLAVFTHEPHAESFGDDGYKLFVDPADIAADFGSSSVTTALVNSIFSQRPNIRANGGYCAVIPMLPSIQKWTFSAAPASGAYALDIDGDVTPALNWDDTAASIQSKIRGMGAAFASVVVSGDSTEGFTIKMAGVYGPVAAITADSNTLSDASSDPITLSFTDEQVGETVAEAITRADSLIHFFGAVLTVELAQADLLAAAEVLAPMRKIGFFLGSQAADNQTGGKLDLLRQNGYVNSRGLLRIDTVLNGLKFCAGYAARGLSVDFSGNNTTLTMHLKDLVGISADQNISQNILNQAKASGADVYVSFRGVPKVFTSGANDYFDNVYNILAYIESLQVAEFNTLAQVGTKIPQTESGMDILKAAARRVCEQFLRNGFIAPGEWTSPVTFGNQADFYENISQRGYYIYSTPIALQSAADREARKAPLIQIALKYAGAIHSGTIIVNINE